MTDIVERLRKKEPAYAPYVVDEYERRMAEAADEIERLRGMLERICLVLVPDKKPEERRQ